MASQDKRASPVDQTKENEETSRTVPANKPDDPLKAEEQKFKEKYPNVNRSSVPSLLQKRLHKGMKYFDSGDYNMAKDSARKKGAVLTPASMAQGKSMAAQEKVLQESTGETIPTPQNVPARKISACVGQPVHPVTMRAGLQS